MDGDEDCKCETEVKPGSPGLLVDSEVLIYILLDPDHVQAGKLKPNVFNKKNLSGQLSVCRKSYTDLNVALSEVYDVLKRKNPSRTLVGALCAQACRVRAIRAEGLDRRIYCAVDDPILPTFVGHAFVTFSEFAKSVDWKKRKNGRAEIIGNLLKVFDDDGVYSVQDAFS